MAVKPRKATRILRDEKSPIILKKGRFLSIKGVFFIVCLFLGYYGYSHWRLFLTYLDPKPLSAFALSDNVKYTTNQDIRNALFEYKKDVGKLGGYFSQDLTRIRYYIEKMPWVKGVLVRKVWPDKLGIVVVEYHPVAYWNDTKLLADDGTIFSLPTNKYEKLPLPVLRGDDFQSRDVLAAYHEMNKALLAKHEALSSLTIDARGSWQIKLKNGIVLKLGRGDWRQKIEHFATIYPQIETPPNQRINYIDLRYHNGAAIGFKPISIKTK